MKSPADKKLNLLRKKVEKVDTKIIKLIGNRFISTSRIQNLKRVSGLQIHQRIREKKLISRYRNLARKENVPSGLTEKIFDLIFSYSKK